MTEINKLAACKYLTDKGNDSLGYLVHMFGLDLLFNTLAHEEYLKKKLEFTKPLRNKKGQFQKNDK